MAMNEVESYCKHNTAQAELEDISDQEAELCIRSARAAKAHHQHPSPYFPGTDNDSENRVMRSGRKSKARDAAYFDVGLLLDDNEEILPEHNECDDTKVTVRENLFQDSRQ